MGTSYISYAVIGVKVDPEKLKVHTEQRGCKCGVDYAPCSPPKFCPECGSKFIKPDWDYIPEFSKSNDSYLGYKVVFGTDRITAYICLTSTSDWSYPNKPLFSQLPTKEMKEKFKNDLNTAFWDAKKYGMYAVQHRSY